MIFDALIQSSASRGCPWGRGSGSGRAPKRRRSWRTALPKCAGRSRGISVEGPRTLATLRRRAEQTIGQPLGFERLDALAPQLAAAAQRRTPFWPWSAPYRFCRLCSAARPTCMPLGKSGALEQLRLAEGRGPRRHAGASSHLARRASRWPKSFEPPTAERAGP